MIEKVKKRGQTLIRYKVISKMKKRDWGKDTSTRGLLRSRKLEDIVLSIH